MKAVKTTKTFDRWFTKLRKREHKTASHVGNAIYRLIHDESLDIKGLFGGVSEIRIHAGSGTRIYFTTRGAQIIILLAGGDKGTQQRDINRARKLNENIGNQK